MNSSKTLFDSAMGGDGRALAALVAEEEAWFVRQKPSGSRYHRTAGWENQLIDRLASIGRRGESIAILAVDPHHPFQVERFSEMGREWYSRTPPRPSNGFPRAVLENLNRVRRIVEFYKLGWDRILIETVGAGQGEFAIAVADVMLVEGPDRGDIIQAEKAGILEMADIIACNKSDLPGTESANSRRPLLFRTP